MAQRVARLEKALALDLPYPAVRAALELLKETGDEEAHKEASRRVEAYYRERGEKILDELVALSQELGI